MNVTTKFMVIGTTIESLIVAYGVYYWFCEGPSESFKLLMLYAAMPIVPIWLLSICTSVYFFRHHRNE